MPLIIPANSASASGYAIDNSCRFNDGSSDYLNKSNGTPTNADRCTISCWVKRGNLVEGMILGNYSSASFRARFGFDSNHKLEYNQVNDGSVTCAVTTNMVFRDTSAWYHIVCAVDTTDGTASNRIKIYVNGTQVDVTFATNIDQNLDFKLNQASVPLVVGQDGNNAKYFDGYQSETVFIDGTQNAVTDFGEFDEDSGIWKPIDGLADLTFGTNGFYLDFEDSAALGDDVSGNGNDFTVNNLTAIDQTTDTPTNNFATWNPLVHYSTSATFSEGNLKVTPQENTSRVYTVSTIAMPTVSGSKWYAEFKLLANDNVGIVGILDAAQTSFVFHNNSDLDNQNGDTSVGRVTYRVGNGLIKYPSGQSVDTTVTTTNGQTVMIALDSGNGKVWFGKDGTWFNSGDPGADSGGVDFTGQSWWTSGVDAFVFLVGDGSTGGYDNWSANFGNPPYTISSGNADGNSRGNFEYSVPSGFLSLCTKNLSEILS